MRLITGTKDKGLGSEGCQLSSVESIKTPQKKGKKECVKTVRIIIIYIVYYHIYLDID